MNILITAGATWVKVDEVRIITNIFTGNTGLFLAKALAKKGHKVTLLINPHCFDKPIKLKGVRVIEYRYFDELKTAIKKIVGNGPARSSKNNKFQAIIHSAAVSDYKLAKNFKGKIPSAKKNLSLNLAPTEKLVKLMLKSAPKAFVVQFKLEMDSCGLLEKAQASLIANETDAVVANAYNQIKKEYKAYIISRKFPVIEVDSKAQLVDQLANLIQKRPKNFVFGFGEKVIK